MKYRYKKFGIWKLYTMGFLTGTFQTVEPINWDISYCGTHKLGHFKQLDPLTWIFHTVGPINLGYFTQL